MKTQLWITSLLIMFNISVKSQNLVPNWSFEQRDSCPDGPDEIESCIGWQKYSEAISTPDYYNACAPVGYFNVPFSGNGFQEDHRNCSAFMGLVTYAPTPINYRELIGIQLNQTLVMGQKYFLSFNTVMVELIEPNGYYDGMPSNNIGLRLSTVPYTLSNPCPINNFAHLYSANVINDTINWIRISGSIVADSAYNYLSIGNFFDDLNTDTLHLTCDSCNNYVSYYYVDDVCLSTDSLLCNGGIDNIPCTVGIKENEKINEAIIYPIPTSDELNITFSQNKDVEILLIDFFGKIVLRNILSNKKDCTLNLSPVSSGCYFLKIVNTRNRLSSIKKIIKI